MISVDDALSIILDTDFSSKVVEKQLKHALGYVVAKDVVSDIDLPIFDNSAMDGYAVQYEDTVNASKDNPVSLKIIDRIQAGIVSEKTIKPGEAIQIMTGAPIPKGANAVVKVEDTKEDSKNVVVFTPVSKNENVRFVGENIKKGEHILSKGDVLSPARIGILASLGRPIVNVIDKPNVAIISTGDELVEIDEPLIPGKIRSSNNFSLSALTKSYDANPVDLGIARDTKSSIRQTFEKALESDVIVSTGGVSVGEYDYVQEVLNELGFVKKFWRIKMRPGKPVLFGTLQGKPVFGLPGNPVSCMITFILYVRPLLLRMMGYKETDLFTLKAELSEDLSKSNDLRVFLRGKLTSKNGTLEVKTTTENQGSHILSSLHNANCLIAFPEDERELPKGSRVTVYLLNF